MLLFLSIAATLFASVEASSDDLNKQKSLKFFVNSYIEFSPDWSSLTNEISVCAWIKDTGTSTYRTFFSYGTSRNYEMTILAGGSHIGIFGSYMDKRSSFTVPRGTWHHVCTTWSLSSRTHRYYVNGVLLGSQTTTSGRTFRTGGNVVVGKWVGTSEGQDFAGEMAYLNMYKKELSGSEVASMAEPGMCSNIAAVDQNEAYKVIKWEDIMMEERSGDIADNYVEECIVARTDLEKAERKQNSTAEELRVALAEKEELSTRLNLRDREKEELSTRLNSTILELEEVKEEKTRTEERLNATHAELEETAEELEEMLASLNRTWDWNVFLTDQFVNKTFTAENLILIQSSWDKVAEALVGMKITDRFLNLLQQLDKTEDRPWAVLREKFYFNQTFTEEMSQRLTTNWDEIGDKLVGVTFTEAIVELLNYVTQRANCGK